MLDARTLGDRERVYALVRLQQDGLVEREPNRGARVRRVSEQEAVEILEARAALEGLAAGYAVQRAT